MLTAGDGEDDDGLLPCDVIQNVFLGVVWDMLWDVLWGVALSAPLEVLGVSCCGTGIAVLFSSILKIVTSTELVVSVDKDR